jgi:hypothetical protein
MPNKYSECKGYDKKQCECYKIREKLMGIIGKEANQDVENTPDESNRNPSINQYLFDWKALAGTNQNGLPLFNYFHEIT